MDITPELAELFGVYAGDGSMSARRDGRPSLAIAACKDKKEWLSHVANLFEQVFSYCLKVRWESNVYKIQIRTCRICDFFRSAGFPIGKKALTVRLHRPFSRPKTKAFAKRF